MFNILIYESADTRFVRETVRQTVPRMHTQYYIFPLYISHERLTHAHNFPGNTRNVDFRCVSREFSIA